MIKRLSLFFVASVCLFALGALLVACPASTNRATVELEGNETTGYTWIYSMDPEGVVKEVSSEYVQDSNPLGMSGVGGTFKFTFEAVAEGEAEITFSYLREWEDDPPASVVHYRAIVDAENNLTLTVR